ncbi:MAG: phosphohydrolase [Spirochaetae bacterium HGW-Spirochaetae-3]|jgi:HD superfamily phosphohydrolase|nr:MAG: phosphohydrolase [Spirochaetae bacterium HGW-Spirochaetae-3]
MKDLWVRLGIAFDEPVRDPLWRNIMVPREFSGVVESPEFMKLSRILQLGPTQIVYPGATHTRRAHSLGVFELAKRSLAALASRSDLETVDAVGGRSFLVAALCHDLGHFPYAHSLKELPLRDHESLTADVVRGPLRTAVLGAGADPETVAAIVDQELPAPPAAGPSLGLYRSLLSGVLDPDKLDYLNRDAWACGVPYGLQDVDFTLQHLGLDETGRPGISERGIMAVEAVLFSKYQMYRAVYWHKSVRAATAMIKKAVVMALESGNLAPDDLYGLDDQGFYALMAARKGRDGLGLIKAVFDGSVMKPRLEIAFDPNDPAHRRAADLGSRPSLEAEIARLGGVSEVVVDVPEPISFESDLPIIGSGAGFSASSTVFRPEVVDSFARSLRVMRVFSDAEGRVAESAGELLGRR